MRIVFRADSSVKSGTGHVMRCLTLMRESIVRGHDSILITNDSEVPWLEQTLLKLNIPIEISDFSNLDSNKILSFSPDVVVLDSYEFNSDQISILNKEVPVAMFADGESRGIKPQIFIDQNLGAEDSSWVRESTIPVLAGSIYSLVRPEIQLVVRDKPWIFSSGIPRLLVSLGGTDPFQVSGVVAKILSTIEIDFLARIIVPPEQIEAFQRAYIGNRSLKFAETSRNFEAELEQADIVISATGSSSWEICTLGIPALFIAVAENQLSGLNNIRQKELGETVNMLGKHPGKNDEISSKITRLLTDELLRQKFSLNCKNYFDGLGAKRVLDQLEKIAKN